MITTSSPPGIALLCDERGVIQNVIMDGIGLDGLASGQPLRRFVDPGSRTKLQNFLQELRENGAAFDWEINLPNGEENHTIRLAGALGLDSLFFLVGAYTPHDAMSLCDELMKINSELAATLRSTIKDQMQNISEQHNGEMAYFNEISRLNNELISLQRDLAKKNIELERLYDEVKNLVITDELTGLYNRRGLFDMGNREIERAKRFRHPLSAIMFDLDHFKRINDTFGHMIGDQVLVKTVERCRQMLRRVDVFSRYGGDEFTILLPESDLSGACQAAERLRKEACKPMEIEHMQITVTLSLGVAAMEDDSGDLIDFLQQADWALFRAKDESGNQVCIATRGGMHLISRTPVA